MKKYVKPELFYERFELSQHIADCAWEMNSGDKNTCSAVADPDFSLVATLPNLFVAGNQNCILQEGKNYDAFCYHNSAETGFPNVFAS